MKIKELFDLISQGYIPEDFDEWDIADDEGTTAAHIAAMYGLFPIDFDYWSWEDQQWWWELTNNYGATVADYSNSYLENLSTEDADEYEKKSLRIRDVYQMAYS
jgi:hypothetical protein